MANPNRATYDGPKLSGPGIFYSLSKPKQISEDTYNKWYNEVHIPDILATGHVTVANRFRDVNPNVDRPYLAIYQVPDLGIIQTEKFKSVPMTSDLMPNGGPCHDYIDFDTRFYKLDQDYNTKGETEDGHFPIVLAAGMEPGDGKAEDLDRWYREEHLEQMSREPGWRRARRYNLVFQVKDKNAPSPDDAPSFLTLYDFDESAKQLGTDVKPLDPITDWTKKCMANAKKIEAGIYRRTGVFKSYSFAGILEGVRERIFL